MVTGTAEESPFYNIMAEISESMKHYEKLKDSLMTKLDFRRLPEAVTPESARPVNFAAVDSSSARVLDAGCFVVIAYRSAAVLSTGAEPIRGFEPRTGQFQLALVNINEKAVEYNLHRFLTPLCHAMDIAPELIPELNQPLRQSRPREIDYLQFVRAVGEWHQVRKLLDRLESGDIILRDGPLRPDIRIPPALVENILRLAAERGIHIVGIVKRSSVPVGPMQLMPIVSAIQRVGAMEHPSSCWYTPLPSGLDESEQSPFNFARSYITLYHPLSQYVFWTDINKFDTIEPVRLLEQISTLCSDPVYIGYPYPLAHAHNNVILTRGDVDDIRYQFQAQAFETGTLDQNAFQMLFGNFHEVLDLNIY